MRKKNINIKKLLIPSDGIPIVVIVIGLLIVIFLPDTAIKLIGACVSVLGLVALIMLISQRLNDIVGSGIKQGSPPQGIKIKVVKGTGAIHKEIDGFNSSFGPEEETISKNKKSKIETLPEDSVAEEFVPKKYKAPDNIGAEYVDDSSAVKIVGIKKKQDAEKIDINKTAQTPDNNTTKDFIKEEVNINQTTNLNKQIADAPQDNTDKDINQNISSTPFKEKQVQITPIVEAKSNEPQSITFVSEHANIQNTEDNAPLVKPSISLAKESIKQTIDIRKAVKNTNYKEKKIEIPISDLIESEQLLGKEPKKEFEYFISRVLMIIRSVTNTKTASFMLYNDEKQQLIGQSFVSDNYEIIKKGIRFKLGSDVISRIAKNAKPEILTEINPAAELDLLPYYTKNAGVSSYIGVPVFYHNSVIGVLSADSTDLDAFDVITVGFLGHFTKLLGSLVVSYTEKYDLMQSSKTLSAINTLKNLAFDNQVGVDGLLDALVEVSSNMYDYTTVGVCCLDESQGGWIIKSCRVKNQPSKQLNKVRINVKSSLISRVIETRETIIVNQLDNKSVRVHKNEHPLPGGFFAAIPVRSIQNVYAILFIEAPKGSALFSTDIEILGTLAEQTGTGIEQIMNSILLNSSVMTEANTGILNQTAFVNRLEEEIYRSMDYNYPIVLCLFKIDKYASVDPVQFRNRYELAIRTTLEIIKKNMRIYNVVGKLDYDVFGIIICNMDINNTKIWAERIRKEVAATLFEDAQRKFSITISLGIADSVNIKSMEDIITRADKALTISSKKTNSIMVFS